MKPLVSDATNHLLLAVYRLAREVPAEDFQRAALALLAAELPFDSAIWRRFTEQRGAAQASSVYRHGGAKGGGHDAACVLSLTLPEPESALITSIALYRHDGARPFSETERARLTTWWPHWLEAFRLNGALLLGREAAHAGAPSRARGRIDAQGLVHQAGVGLSALLRCEMATSTGEHVPPSWLDALRQGHRFHGKTLVVSVLQRLPDGTLVIEVRHRAAADRLSTREVAIVRALCSGRTHRMIATQFGTSPATVRTQIRTAYAKLGVHSKGELGRLLTELE